MRVGIPYAPQTERDGKVFATCPVCNTKIELTSIGNIVALSNYQRHYLDDHETFDLIVQRLQAVADTQRGVVQTDFAIQKTLLAMQTAREIKSWGVETSTMPTTLVYSVGLPDHDPKSGPAFVRVRVRPLS